MGLVCAQPALLERLAGEPVLRGVPLVQLVLALVLVDHAQAEKLLERPLQGHLDGLVVDQVGQDVEEGQEDDEPPDEHTLQAQDEQGLVAV